MTPLTPPSAKPPISEKRLAIICAFIVALGPVSLSLYTPAMPSMVQALSTTPEAIKLTLVIYFAGFAMAQLVCGPLSDAFGRKPVGVGFFALYVAGSVLATVAPVVEWLLVGRGLQGVGAAAGVALSRAMVRDLITGFQAARVINLIGLMLAIGPAMAPTIGGVILTSFGWEAIFIVMIIYGTLAVLVLMFAVPETNKAPNKSHAYPTQMIRNYVALLRDKQFVRPALTLGAVQGGYYSLAVLLPFVMIDRIGVSPEMFGLLMLIQTGSYFTGTVITARLLRRSDGQKIVPLGLATASLAALAWVILLNVYPASIMTVMGPVIGWALSVAFINPGATTRALAPYPHLAGSAAAMVAFIQIGLGLLGGLAGSFLGNPVVALFSILPAMALIALAAHFLLSPVQTTSAQ